MISYNIIEIGYLKLDEMIYMPSKTLCIKDDIYENLIRLKMPSESFSDLLKRMISNIKQEQNNHLQIMKEVFGAGKDLISEQFMKEFSEIQQEINSEFEIRLNKNNTN